MKDVCGLLGIEKLNTTAYHPQCNGLTERFNRTLKTMIRKHSVKFGSQWDQYLHGVLWAYRNTPHESTHEKPSFLLFGVDCRYPTEAALLPPTPVELANVDENREELILSLSNGRKLATESIQAAQDKYKKNYDRKSAVGNHRVGDWVLIRFPQEESGANRKLSRPWHGPFRVTDYETGITAVKVYAPQEPPIKVHLSRVTRCPSGFPAGNWWYGSRRAGPGRPPKWIDRYVASQDMNGSTGSSQDTVPQTTNECDQLGDNEEESMLANEVAIPPVEQPMSITAAADAQEHQLMVDKDGTNTQIESPHGANPESPVGSSSNSQGIPIARESTNQQQEITPTTCARTRTRIVAPPDRLTMVCSRTSSLKAGSM